jgi:hypothetical protein
MGPNSASKDAILRFCIVSDPTWGWRVRCRGGRRGIQLGSWGALYAAIRFATIQITEDLGSTATQLPWQRLRGTLDLE